MSMGGHRVTIVMGVAGSGKSTWAAERAGQSGAVLVEGDHLHNTEALAKMAAGMPLDDADRWPWLARIAAAVNQARLHGPVIVTCSALRRVYRDCLRDRIPPPRGFVFLDVPQAELIRRLAARRGHFAGPELLASQLATLEPPTNEDEVEWIVA